jgi:hypothetical protein
LIVEIEAIGDKLFDFNVGRAFKGPAAAWTSAFAAVAAPIVSTAISAAFFATIFPVTGSAISTLFAAVSARAALRCPRRPVLRRPIFTARFVLPPLLRLDLLFRRLGRDVLGDGSSRLGSWRRGFGSRRLRRFGLYFFVHK